LVVRTDSKVYKLKEIYFFMVDKIPNDTRYLHKNGQVTSLFRKTCAEVLREYTEFSRFASKRLQRDSEDFNIREAYVVGSVLRGVDNSDLDLLMIANKIDNNDYKLIKQYLSQIFFNPFYKSEAVDVYIRPYDEFPDKPRFEVTAQIRDLLEFWNRQIVSP
jgi:predicted nucleotidyltransferase